MSRSFRVAAILAVTALILAAPVFGQQSNTSRATAEVFTSDVDDSMSVYDYSGVEFDKWFGFIGYGGAVTDTKTGVSDLPLQMGFATRFGGSEGEGEDEGKSGGLYLGLFYAGNLLQIEENYDKNAVRNFDLDNQVQRDKITTTSYQGYTNTISSNNELQALIGVNGMGFKVRFAEDVKETTYPNKDITITENHDGTVTHSSGNIIDYSNVDGILSPSVEWGMALDVGSITIRPLVGLGVEIGLLKTISNSRIKGQSDSYTTIDGVVVGSDTIYHDGLNESYATPNINVGAGIDIGEFNLLGIIFENVTMDVGYGISLPIYRNKYDVAGFSNTAGRVIWDGSSTTTSKSIDTTETASFADLLIYDYSSYHIHDISLGLLTHKEVAEGLKLGLSMGIGLNIEAYKYDRYHLQLEKNETNYNNDALSSGDTTTEIETRSFGSTEDYTQLSIEPYINIGASYALVPNRLSINAGVAMKPAAYQNTITRTSTYGDGTLDGDNVKTEKRKNKNGDVIFEEVTITGGGAITDTVDVSGHWDFFDVNFTAGFVFNFTEKLALDTYVGVTSAFRLNVVDLNVLFSVKF